MSSRGGVAGIGGLIAAAAWCGTAGAKRWRCRSSAAVASSDAGKLPVAPWPAAATRTRKAFSG